MIGQISFFDNLKVKFIKDCTILHNSFVTNSIHDCLFEQENNYIIKIDGVYYGALKSNCIKI